MLLHAVCVGLHGRKFELKFQNFISGYVPGNTIVSHHEYITQML